MAPRYKIEHFKEAELLVDITEHILVPTHEVLTSEEKRELLLRFGLLHLVALNNLLSQPDTN